MAGGNEPFSIAMDAMGGDHAPASVVEGALAYAQGQDAGRSSSLATSRWWSTSSLGSQHRATLFPIVHAPDTVGMGEAAATAVRRKPNSSIAVCARLAKDGEADAIVSAGNTGAAVAGLPAPPAAAQGGRPARHRHLGPDAERRLCLARRRRQLGMQAQPHGPVRRHGCGLRGAHPRPEASPRVGLLNIGEESTKGNELAQATYPLLAQQSGFHFVGNVEGRDIFRGARRRRRLRRLHRQRRAQVLGDRSSSCSP